MHSENTRQEAEGVAGVAGVPTVAGVPPAAKRVAGEVPAARAVKYLVGTSGYSFADWVGVFYPPDTQPRDMFQCYAQRFETVELNFTFYAMPAARTLQRLVELSGPRFGFWAKANQGITHEQRLACAGEFLASLQPLRDSGKLCGVLLQFPQSFHRTVENRKYLAGALDGLGGVARAVEFRHASWGHPSTVEGLRRRDVTLVIPDAPPIRDLYRPAAAVTNRTGYLRLHSRNAKQWYAGMAERYDYNYSDKELGEILQQWSRLDESTDRVYAFFNNCHRGQAGQNAESFRRLLGQIE